MRCHDLHGDGRFSLLALAREREAREERRDRKEKRRQARAARPRLRLLAILARAVRWHLWSPDWSLQRPPAPSFSSQAPAETPAVERFTPERIAGEPVIMPALEHLMEARNAAQRDGEAELAAVIRAVVLFYLTGNLGDFYERSAAALKLYDDMMAEPVGRVH